MKINPVFPRVAVLALALGSVSVTAAFAQTAPMVPKSGAPATTMTPAPAKQKGGKHAAATAMLTPAEKAQLEKDTAAVLASNPTLKAEADDLQAQHAALKAKGKGGDPDAKKALKMQAKEHKQKMEIAILKIDPSAAPIFSKMKGAHKDKKNGGDAA